MPLSADQRLPGGDRSLRRHWIALLLGITVVLMTALSMEQQRIIESQNSLIQVLAHDSLMYLHWVAQQHKQPRK